MKQKNKKAHKNYSEVEEINLDAVLNNDDPEVRQAFSQFMSDEIELAHERAIIRSGLQFRHLLPLRQQELVIKRAEELSLVTA